jgi:hypothetical protein
MLKYASYATMGGVTPNTFTWYALITQS